VNVRSGPGETYPSVEKLRTGIVLKVAETVTSDGREWYKLAFDREVRYPERISSDWYVAADVVHVFTNDGDHVIKKGETASTTKRIVVDRSEQMLYAYDGDALFMKEPISTGLELTPTPRGKFTVFKMTPSRYMQGPLPGVSDQYYDLPGVPWNLYFTDGGAVIHGAYWHVQFGKPWSHGCVNLPPQKAKELYQWAEIGTKVTVQD
jgi:lipoprotein-anchoring transpeptidase ErfK/SrfK